MELSINISYISKTVGDTEAARLLSENGFTALDYTPSVANDDWKAEMHEKLKIFNEFGLHVHQTHAPFNRYGKWGDKHRLCVERALEATAEMGAKYMVVHGDEFDYNNLEYSHDAALAYNHDYFLPYVEAAEKNGVNLAFENLFCEPNHSPRFCSQTEELVSLIKSFNSRAVSCCWDFGHGHISFKENLPSKTAEVAELITCTHVHDNNSHSDEHLPPFFERIDWKACMDVLRSANYNGTLSYELVHGAIPPSAMPDFIGMLKHIGKELWE